MKFDIDIFDVLDKDQKRIVKEKLLERILKEIEEWKFEGLYESIEERIISSMYDEIDTSVLVDSVLDSVEKIIKKNLFKS